MKIWLAVFTVSLSVLLFVSQAVAFPQHQSIRQAKPVTSKTTIVQSQGDERKSNLRTADGKIHFSFQDQEWRIVIPWFCDQAGFSLQNVEDWPEDTFSLQDKDSYTTLEALDQLNRSLAGLSTPFTLIRKRKMLMLKPINEAISSELIDSVSPADLDQRGSFELMSVMFDLGELDSEVIYDELKSQVSQPNKNHFHTFSVSNQLQVRETGARLRNIRNIIETAKRKLADEKPSLLKYQLKFQDTETFMAVVGAQLGIQPGETSDEDGEISIIADPLSNLIYVSGPKRMLDRFSLIAKTVDSDPNIKSPEVAIERPFLRTYGVTVDPKLAFDLLGTMLEGSDARMQQDEVSGAITVLGRKEDHERVVESLASVSDLKTKNFAIITLQKVSVTEVLGVLQSIYRKTVSAEAPAANNGPVLMANTYLNQIIVSGSSKEVAEIRSIAEEFDARYVPVDHGPRTNVRIIPMTERDQERLAPALGDLLGTVGRKNPFNIIRPNQRKDFDERIHRRDMKKTEDSHTDDQFLQEMLEELPSKKRSQLELPKGAQAKLAGCFRQASALAVLAVGADYAQIASNMMVFQQASQTATEVDKNSKYRSPLKKESIAGAPIEFRFTEYGLTVESDDLDAADDIQAAIKSFLGETKEVQLPSFFELQHRSVQEMQQLLEAILGISDTAAAGDPLTGVVDNMLPGGELFDGLLGGLGGAESTSDLEGDVRFGADVRFNTLWVTGATGNDLSRINSLVEYWDRPEGETKPQLFGKTRMIKVYYRDAVELVDLIKSQRPEMIYRELTVQGGKDEKETAKIMKAVKSKADGKGGQGGSTSSGAKQTVILGADEANNTILVTGPPYMYDDIFAFVKSIDVAPSPRSTEVLPNVPNAQFLLNTLMQKYPGQLMVAGEDMDQMPGASESSQQGSRSSGSSKRAKDDHRTTKKTVDSRQEQGAGAGGRGGAGRGGAGRGGGGRGPNGGGRGGSRGGGR